MKAIQIQKKISLPNFLAVASLLVKFSVKNPEIQANVPQWIDTFSTVILIIWSVFSGLSTLILIIYNVIMMTYIFTNKMDTLKVNISDKKASILKNVYSVLSVLIITSLAIYTDWMFIVALEFFSVVTLILSKATSARLNSKIAKNLLLHT